MLAWLILAHHGLQDAFKPPHRASRTPPRALQTPPKRPRSPPRQLQGRSKRPQEAPTSIQDAQDLFQDRQTIPKRPLDASKNRNIASKIVQNARKLPQNFTPLQGSCQVLANFQNTPGMFIPRSQVRWLTVKFVPVYQGWSGGGSPA